jgi:hypothetical protein
MKTIIAASTTDRRTPHKPIRKFAVNHHRPSHQWMGQPRRTKETRGEVIFTSFCVVILLAFIAYFAWYLFTYSPLV